jgi:hypothetical protein
MGTKRRIHRWYSTSGGSYKAFMQGLSSFLRRVPFATNQRPLTAPLLNSARFTNYRGFLFRPAHTATRTTSFQLSTSMVQSPQSFGNYDLIKRVKLDFTDVVVSKWKSRITGLTVVHLDYEGTRIIPLLSEQKLILHFAP